jgi:hypothetical protein
MKTKILFYFFLLSFTFCLFSCDTNDPPPPDNGNGKEKKITLTVDDTSPTEVWLNLVTENIALPDTVTLLRNNTTVKTIELFDSSYVVYQDSLLPSQSYTYQVTKDTVISNEAVAVTMDTTSHNFTWEVFEFGEHGNSILRDVAIIDENDIWAVGAIYLKDSTGANDPKLYNAVHWDGNQWEVKRVTVDYKGNPITIDMEGVFAFGATDIWMVGSLPIYGDGENWEIYDVRDITNSDLSLSKAWGTSSNNIYFVGRAGSIAHYNGSSWKKIESGTEVDLRDVWGDDHGNVWSCGYSSDFSQTVLLYYDGSTSHIVYEGSPNEYVGDNFIGSQSALWVSEKGKVYVMNHRYLARVEKEPFSIYRKMGLSSDILLGMAMREKNNALMVGQDGLIGIYNGRSYKENREYRGRGYYLYEADLEENTSAIIGQRVTGIFNNSALVIIGK